MYGNHHNTGSNVRLKMKKILLFAFVIFITLYGVSFAGLNVPPGSPPGYVSGDDAVFGSVTVGTTTVATAGPHDDIDVSGVCVVKVDTSSYSVTIGGLTGGVDGQSLTIYVVDATNNCTIENAEASAGQDIYL